MEGLPLVREPRGQAIRTSSRPCTGFEGERPRTACRYETIVKKGTTFQNTLRSANPAHVEDSIDFDGGCICIVQNCLGKTTRAETSRRALALGVRLCTCTATAKAPMAIFA